MKKTMGDNQKVRHMYALIKSRRDVGDYKTAQELANNFVQIIGALHRTEKNKKFTTSQENQK